MSIFKFSKQGTVESRLVGAQLPSFFHEYLTLYGLANGVSKSLVLRKVLEEWMNKQPPTKSLIPSITKLLKDEYQTRTTPRKKDMFLGRVRSELERKGVSEYYIMSIIQTIQA